MTVTWWGLLLVLMGAVTEALGQICLKQSSRRPLQRARWIALGIVMFALQAVVYTAALQRLDVSVAYAIGSVHFVMVALGSARWLGESVPRTHWVGIAFILAGCATLAAHG